ncbi:hypothetical protein [Streptomyces netropsis]|uniref:Uncharacterized protein n=1 Tax=Streptomyces netropsis TaxID=55404 RepID=A0A7W7L946_STRNE|nr:hypothetical protein [Streptomyces netropsis]MBB4885712.1 hypothetical protein [Streptomyces netropsis]GGR36723.1 hypothetical protein GCM10010219_47130 [Streptomyces netropsis]
MSELYRSDRYFKVWQYTVSHRRLLLRSTLDNPPSTRIDVHFGGVSLMLLRPYYEGLVIREGTEKEHRLVASEYGVRVDLGSLFILGQDLSSFVVSGKPQWHEDEGEFGDPSWFGHMIGTP